jgi:hypothetical protein
MEDGLGRLIVNEPNYNAETIHKHAGQFSKKNFINSFKYLFETFHKKELPLD